MVISPKSALFTRLPFFWLIVGVLGVFVLASCGTADSSKLNAPGSSTASISGLDARVDYHDLGPLRLSSTIRVPTADEANNNQWLWAVQELSLENMSKKGISFQKPKFSANLGAPSSFAIEMNCGPLRNDGVSACLQSLEYGGIRPEGTEKLTVNIYKGLQNTALRPGEYSHAFQLNFVERGSSAFFDKSDADAKVGSLSLDYKVPPW